MFNMSNAAERLNSTITLYDMFSRGRTRLELTM